MSRGVAHVSLVHNAGPWHAATFVGRRDELAWIADTVAARDRLIVLTGPAGIGKTRLAAEYAHTQDARPATFCALVTARGVDDVCDAVAAALGLALVDARSSGEAVARIARHLAAHGPRLLVL